MIKNIYICDICGKEKAKSTEIANLRIGKCNSSVDADEYDICEECRKDLTAFVTGKKASYANK